MENLILEINVDMSKGSDPNAVMQEVLAIWPEYFLRRGNASYEGTRDVQTMSGSASVKWVSS